MSLKFTAASSQVLYTSPPPFTMTTFTVGVWAKPLSLSASNWAVVSPCGSGGDWQLYRNTANWIVWNNSAGTIVGTAVQEWTFLLWRWISSTNIRSSVLNLSGTVTHTQITASLPQTPNNLVLGGTLDTATPASGAIGNPWEGMIGPFWVMDTDPIYGGGVAEDSYIRQLAFRGPFSIPDLGPRIVEYHSFWSTLPDLSMDGAESWFSGRYAPSAWVNRNGVVISGDNPPLIGGYRMPRQSRSRRIVPI